jgi:hypothetical protein
MEPYPGSRVYPDPDLRSRLPGVADFGERPPSRRRSACSAAAATVGPAWLLSASLTGCGPACDSQGAVLATRSAGRTWTLALPGR